MSEAPLLIVIFLALANEALITGWNGVPGKIATSVVGVGIPPHQLAALFQSVFTTPTQVLAADIVKVDSISRNLVIGEDAANSVGAAARFQAIRPQRYYHHQPHQQRMIY